MYNLTAFNMLVKDADQYHTALLVAEVLADQAADGVLRHVADLIKRSFRSVDHICRISHTRFAVIMSRVDSSIQEQVAQKIEHINEALGEPGRDQSPVSLAVGVAFADRHDPGGGILEDAEAALLRLKERGEAGCAFH